ncbi:MAG: helix-turn-helix domain-containing protein [Alphaproteobacteria bacterium]
MITPAQCKGARAMVDLSRRDLAERAGIAERTLVDFERGARTPHPNNLSAIRRALESAGVEFIPENGGGPGVRLRKGG